MDFKKVLTSIASIGSGVGLTNLLLASYKNSQYLDIQIRLYWTVILLLLWLGLYFLGKFGYLKWGTLTYRKPGAIAAFFLAGCFLVIWIPVISEKIVPKIPSPKSKFSILIMPFEDYCDLGDGNGQIDVGKAIQKRLSDLKQIYELDLDIYYNEDYSYKGIIDINVAKSILYKNGYDLIVYGDKQSSICNENGQNLVCVRYSYNENRNNIRREIETPEGRLALHPVDVNGLLRGDLQNGIDYITFSILSSYDKYLGQVDRALDKYVYLYDSLKIQHNYVIKEFFVTALQDKNYSIADRLILDVENRTGTRITDSLFIHTLKI